MVKNLNDSFEKLAEQNNESLEKNIKKIKTFKNNEKKIINKISKNLFKIFSIKLK
ncbi:hypothetical protein [Spiroplasma endosymbiont of Acasis viretata]|uniref:hypothetical protein n=1 Tax=Spiroplasma endosymbiont of Acasis viretata TaxID=3066306 RepID=UPI00313B6049